MSTPTIFNPINTTEVLTDTAGIIGSDLLNNLSLSGDLGFLAGVAVANGFWQTYGRMIVKSGEVPITVTEILKGEAPVIIETDLYYGSVKGLMYTLSIYGTSIVVNGVSGRRNLMNCILDGFVGGQLGGYILRTKAKPSPIR